MKQKAIISRRQFLTIAGGGVVALTFFPKIAMPADNEILAIRTGLRDGNKTRLVIETKQKPGYSLSYPDGQLVVAIDAACRASPSMVDGTLINSIDIFDGKVIANLKKTIAPIPKDQIMLLDPAGGSKWRLVLDFAAASAVAKTKAAAETAAAKKPPAKKPVIVIDPGHGGKDPGCIGITGAKEKDIVLSVAKKLADRLNSAGYNAQMTRKNDIFLNLDTRSSIGEKKKADLFISLHANANPSKQVKGFSVYTLSQTASDAEAQKLAESENAADRIWVDGFAKYEPATRMILSSLQQSAVSEESVKFARKILRASRGSGIDRVEKARRSAPFAVLKSTIPSCLVELGHLSNKDEESLLKSAKHQDKLVSTLITAVGNYEFQS